MHGHRAFPRLLYDHLPYATTYSPYDATHVLTQLQLLFFAAMAFTALKLTRLYPPELVSTNLDAEWFYRGVGPQGRPGDGDRRSPGGRRHPGGAFSHLTDRVIHRTFRTHGPRGRWLAPGPPVAWCSG